MPHLSLELVGSGTHADPYRVALPSYQMVEVDYDRRVALVELPDADLPPDRVHAAVLAAPFWEHHRVPEELREAAVAAWHAHLDERYQEHRGRFRPTIV